MNDERKRSEEGNRQQPTTTAAVVDVLIRNTTDGFIILFAVWTIVAHVIVWSGTGFTWLFHLSPLVVIAAMLWFVPVWRAALGAEIPASVLLIAVPGWTCFSVCAIAIALTAALVELDMFPYAWIGAVVFLLAMRFRPKTDRTHMPSLRAAVSQAWSDYALLAATLILALMAVLLVCRPDPDDSLYLNMAVSVLDAPDQPIFASDTLHGISGGNYLPTYRVHSFELLVALLARVTGRSPIEIAHLWLPLAAVPLSVFALARLFRTLIPDIWAWATMVCVVLLLAVRNTHCIYGNFAYVRIFQGKSWFVLFAVPLIIAYAIEFFRTPDRRNWIILAAGQVAAIGLTANALYAAPLVAAFSMLACSQPDRCSTRRLLAGVTTSAYPMLMVLLVALAMRRSGLNTAGVGMSCPVEATTFDFLGRSGAVWLWMFALLGAWALVRSGWLQRWLLGYSLLFTTLCLSPLWDELLMPYVTGSHLLWRLFWTIPLPVFASVAICESTRRLLTARRLVDRLPGLLVLALILISLRSVVHPEGATSIAKAPLMLKVQEAPYRFAKTIVAMSRPADTVLAPEEVSTWIPTFRGHPRPLVSRKVYVQGLLNVFMEHVDTRDLQARLALSDYVSGTARTDGVGLDFERAIRGYPLSLVAVFPGNPWYREIENVLRDAGYRVKQLSGIQLFQAPDGRGGDDDLPALPDASSSTEKALADTARHVETRLREDQQPAGYWLTSHTQSTTFDHPLVEMNTFLTSMLVDILDPVAADAGLDGSLKQARAYLAGQIEANGLVRYLGRPDSPGTPAPRALITPDSDDTSLVWRITGGKEDLLPGVLEILKSYRTDEGLYRTWLAPREQLIGVDPGTDPNPPDIAIQMHLLMFLSKSDPPAARSLYTALRGAIARNSLWVYYQKTPLVPILRQADLLTAGYPLVLPRSRLQTSVAGQQPWVAACRLIAQYETGTDPTPSASQTVALLKVLADDGVASIRTSPPLMYHNDLSAHVRRFYWSEDLGYALWLRLYFENARAHPAAP
ncbi:MAG: hypothetical protein HYX75_20365 [Acidobacteria bacterium]|nr:hypothetical protein [Acidobacteriota bacterium]